MINNREDIQQFIVSLENRFQVNNWCVNDIHIWPILRIRLYFYLLLEIEGKKKEAKKEQTPVKITFFKTVLYKTKRTFQKLYEVFNEYYLWKQKLPQKNFLFLGTNEHRVDYKGKRYNRFFDVMIEQYHLKDSSMYFEYDSLPIGGQFHKSLLFKFNKALIAFKYIYSKKTTVKMDGYDVFLSFLENNTQTKYFASINTTDAIQRWGSTQLIPKIEFFKKVIKKIAPKKIMILCYYDENIMALVAAANNLGVETVEMQHGPQTSIHLAYGSWLSVPEKGYDMLPRKYWCWDNYSREVVDEWVKGSTLYSSEVIGNPWVDYWKSKQDNYTFKGYILYSLQPNPLTLEQLFNNNLLEFIKKEPFIWFIRLHPRQLGDLNMIKRLLENNEVLYKVNIENATNDPLPQLLANAKIHVTHFSGTAIESSFFGIKTILLNSIGLASFPNLIKENKAVYLDVEDLSFRNKMIEILDEDATVLIKGSLLKQKNDNLFE